MNLRVGIRFAALLTALGLLLTACVGLPTSGAANPGLPIGEDDTLYFTPIAEGPQPGDGPEEIVAGFLEASMTPAGNWEIAREFLTDDFSHAWKPEVGVAIDSPAVKRQFESSVDPEDQEATSAEVQVGLEQIASVDETGAYSADTGTAKAVYRLVRSADDEWRISEGKDGITLDADTFGQVYQKHALKFFDPTWSHLVADVRWFPRRSAMATSVARALIAGKPSAWLEPAVRTAFSPDVSLVGDAVPVDAAQVASVSLTRTAFAASSTVLARMRTQLEASLAEAGVREVRFVVDGTPLDAGTVPVEEPIVDPGVLVFDGETFGTAAGGEISPVAGLTAQIAKISEPIVSVDVALDGALAAVQMRGGQVYAVSAGNTDELDSRAGLITPSLDPFGYVWTVPRGAPGALEARDAQVERHAVAQAWPGAESISQLRVSADGARVAAVVSSGGSHRLVVAAIIRDDRSVPVQLGDEREISRLPGPVRGLSWVGSDAVALLSTVPDPALTMYTIGGPAMSSPAPADAVAVAGAKTSTGLRVLASDGSVYAQRGSSWQVAVSGVLVLGTRAGY